MKHPLAVAALLCGVLTGGAARPEDGPAPDRVEEDWEAVIAEPDLAAEGPQLTTCMTPNGDEPSRFIAFSVNYRLRPSARPGGLEVLAWAGDELLAQATEGDAALETPDETVTWTQELSLAGGEAVFRVRDGRSTTWGEFGAEDRLLVRFATADEDLSRYDPEWSARRSAATWQSDHVASMTLVRVRLYRGTQLVETRELAQAIRLGR
jgi:hypothetical protein